MIFCVLERERERERDLKKKGKVLFEAIIA